MSGAHRSNSRSNTNRKKGTHGAAPKPSRQPYNWLGVSAVTLGLGAAMASGTGIATAKGGADGAGSSSPASSSSSNTNTSTGSGSSSTSTGKGHKHQKKDKTGTDTSSSDAAGSTSSSDSNGSSAASTSGSAGTTTGSGKNKKPKSSAGSTPTTSTKSKSKPTAATATSTDAPSSTPSAASAATAATASPTTASATKAVALSAVAAADTTSTTTTSSTTPHATSTNTIVAAIQTAIINFFTSASTITQLVANDLTGPTTPTTNFIAGFLYGVVRGMEDFAGLVPHTGTPTTTSDTSTGIVTGSLNFTVPAGGPALTYTVATNPLFGSVTVNTDGTFSYKSNIFGAALSALGLNPTDKFTVTASDGIASTNESVTVAVLSANNTPSTPVATNISENIATGVVTGTLSSTSPDGQAVTYNVVTNPIGGSLTVNSATGTFTYTPTALYRQNANLGVITTDTFTVTASNAAGQTSLSGFITVPVSPANNDTPSSPTATNVSTNTVTGVVTGTISSTDPAGAALTYTATQPIGGSLSLNSTTGAFTYTPTALARANANLGVITTDTFTVTASNGTYSATSFITVPIAPASGNTPSTPVVTSQSVNTTTGVVTGTLSSTSPDGATVTYNITSLPTQGTITVSGSTFTYTPSTLAQNEASLGLITSDTFAVTASNGSYTSATGYVTVPVNPVNDTPSTPAATNVNANTVTGAVTGTISSTDPAGQTVTYSVTIGPVGGSVTLNSTTGAFTYTPTALNRQDANLGVITTDSFTVKATNGTYSSSAIITVPVEPSANDTPSTPTSSSLSVNTSTGVVTGTIDSTSPDGSALTYNVTSLPTQGTISVNGNTYTYTPSSLAMSEASLGLITTDVFSVTATNAAGYTSGLGYITVPVTGSNDNPTAPVVTNQTQYLVTGTVSGTITSIDPANQPLTYSVTIGPIGGAVTLNSTTGAFTYTPTQANRQDANLGVIETDSFTVQATNGTYSTSAIVTVPVSPASNDTPSTPSATNVNANTITGVVTGTISSSNPGGQTLTYSVTAGPIGGAVTLNSTTGAFTYTPTTLNRQDANLGVITTDTFTVTASNGTYSSSAMITVPVEPASNDTPTTPVSANQNENIYTGVVSGTVSATSPDGGAITYSITTPTLSGLSLSTGTININSATGAYTYTPTMLSRQNANLGVITTDSFTVTATNAAGYSSNTSITVPISPASNDTPTAPTSATQHENLVTGVVTGTVSATSPDGGAITYSITTPTLSGLSLSTGTISINSATGAYTYTPSSLARQNANLGVITSDTFTVTATNAAGLTSSSSVTVPISPASNDTPSAPTVSNINENTVTGVVTGTLTSVDPGNQTVTYSVVTGPIGGSVSISGNTFTYTPTAANRTDANLGVITTDTFTVNASNGSNTSSSTFVTVPVSPAKNDTPSVPIASNISVNTTTGVVTGTLSSTSPDGATVTYSIQTLPGQGTVTVTGNTFSYAPSSLAQFESQITLLTTGAWATDTFGVTASNGTFSSGSASVTVGISPVSDTPGNPTVSNITANTVTGVVTGTISANDPAGLALTYNVNTGPVGGSVSISGNTFTYTPTTANRTDANLGVITTDTFTISSSNGYYSSGATFVTVPVSPASNDTPSKPNVSNVNENLYTGVVTGTFSSTSPDSSAVTYSVSGLGLSTGSVTVSGNTFTYTPTAFARTDANLGVITSDTFTVTASNSQGISSSSATVTVPISPASNDTPSKPTYTTNENIYTGVVTGTLSSTSPDGAAVTYSISGLGLSTGSLTLSGNTFTYTPTTGARTNANIGVITSDTFTVTASNGNFTSSTATVTVPISPASNDTPSKPTASGQNENLLTGVVTGTASSTSPDGAAVTYSVSGPVLSTGSVSINSTTGVYTYTPSNSARTNANLGVITSDTITITATNPSGYTSSSTTVTVPISPANNDKPSSVTKSNQVQNTSTGVVTGTLSATSPDGAAVTYSITTGTLDGMTLSTGNVSLTTTNGITTFTYAPTRLAMSNSSIAGPYTDTFIVTASNGITSTDTTITVPILAKCLIC